MTVCFTPSLSSSVVQYLISAWSALGIYFIDILLIPKTLSFAKVIFRMNLLQWYLSKPSSSSPYPAYSWFNLNSFVVSGYTAYVWLVFISSTYLWEWIFDCLVLYFVLLFFTIWTESCIISELIVWLNFCVFCGLYVLIGLFQCKFHYLFL